MIPFVSVESSAGVGTITFGSPKANSLTLELIDKLVLGISQLNAAPEVRVILLQSAGEGAFCAGASFDELQTITTLEGAERFFLGFARIILAIRECSKFVVARVQGKAVGGGVGIIAASDYVVATRQASLKLSEFALGFGPFVIGPAVERKIGTASFSALAIDTEWRAADWGERSGLYAQVVEGTAELDATLSPFLQTLVKASPEATQELKKVCWSHTEHFATLLPERAAISARLSLKRGSEQV
jgi:methylglutaconyl-CoA hydratase